jgi:predicted glycoside hydrolase/deacetylase ChbG (UPF0249 family)
LARIAILNVDDLGATHGGNTAFLDLARRGLVNTGSVMAPGPWFREIAEAGAADPSLRLGVHLTLTSEWPHYRWAPLSTTSPASGLIDGDGYMWRDVGSLRRHLVPEAAEAELRAQIERCLRAGMRPTHLDAHMGAAMLAELLPAHVGLAREYDVFPVLPRSITWPPDLAAYRATVAQLDAAGAPVVDHCRGTLPLDADALGDGWRRMIAALPPGVTHFALHATAPGEFEAIAPEHAPWRLREYELLASGVVVEWLQSHGVETTAYPLRNGITAG